MGVDLKGIDALFIELIELKQQFSERRKCSFSIEIYKFRIIELNLKFKNRGESVSKALIKQIPLISNYKEVMEIKKGFSIDEKYVIHMHDGNKKLLLRIFNLEELELRKTEYSIMERMQDYHVTCSQPISIGEVANRGYMITSYIEGKDAEDEISKYSDQEQYNIGIDAGKELRKMHQLSAPDHISSWYSRKVEKHKKYIDAYLACEVKVS
ncbi:aminoglycoside phosphotransferase family protein [Psychrobacillus sp. MER TA 171]|uniref:phosphotransferase n=1 Tax=Psychrobacillus sp. MER TA 171 TaxID=2939577 RepID=UPI00203DBD62|nr:aminoglycoside phosphotransferase family protein [Psychrobacillus sp. MER TA 171]MCM3358008.1 phosphotransferase [Psychrobacillus sp. MER TA 171]